MRYHTMYIRRERWGALATSKNGQLLDCISTLHTCHCRLSTVYRCAVLAVQECGVALEDFNDFREGDVVQCFTLDEVKATV